jgi:outer membrane protein OmpA-like peptidoglycan-associated protein
MRLRTLALAISTAMASSAFAQDTTSTASTTGAIPLTYVGTNAQVGIGINNDGDLSGEATGFLRYTGSSALYGQGWIGQGGAGGLQFGLNWLWGSKTLQDAIKDPDQITVAKSFVAIDRNGDSDRKLTLGGGIEKKDYFFDGYLMQGLTDEHQVASRRSSLVETLTGTNAAGRPFTQTRTTTDVFTDFTKAYNWGTGFRVGHFFDAQLLRLRGGLDYEKGNSSADAVTATVGLQKFFEGTGHSLALDLSHIEKSGKFEIDDKDTRAQLFYRYEFGESYRPAKWEYLRAKQQQEGDQASASGGMEGDGKTADNAGMDTPQPVAVRNEITVDSDAFFNFDKSFLTDVAMAELDQQIIRIKASKLISPITVVGHTCSIGSERYNQGLSERRAQSVKAYLAEHGIDAEMVVEGKGELEPTFPNDTRDNRKKNRRVDVNFITLEEKFEPGKPMEPKATEHTTWTQTEIDVPPGWIERALRNPSTHKREVDTFRTQTKTTSVELGPQVLVNRAPVAVNDTATIARDAAGTLINVLANDTDADGDALMVMSVTQPANGSVTNAGNGVVYTPRAGFVGTDTFTYMVKDPSGATATGTVTITVTAPVVDRPPVAVNDAATTLRDTAVTIDVLANDSDPERLPLTLQSVTTPAHGTASIVAGKVLYTPTAGYAGSDTFNYTIRDAGGNQATAAVNITVTAPVETNRPPVAVADTVRILKAETITVNVLANDSDPDGDALTITAIRVVNSPSLGTSSIVGNRIMFTHRPGTTGDEIIEYTISDGRGGTATARLTINVFRLPGN